MITLNQAQIYTKQRFNEQDVSGRIEDRGFAYYIDTQPRVYIDTGDFFKMTLGNGPIVIIKETGEVYSFSSSPAHMFGSNGIGVNDAKTADEFNVALNELKGKNSFSAVSIDYIT